MILVLGATGMVGQALMRELKRRGLEAVGAAQSGAHDAIDLRDGVASRELVGRLCPSTVINAAAMVDLERCEADPALAYGVNARPVAVLAEACRATGARMVQISTDHYYSGHGDTAHDERAPVQLLNEYAIGKFAAEAFALTVPGALVVRTNVTGFRGTGRPTFIETVCDALVNRRPLTLFEDYYTSTLDTRAFAAALVDLLACEGATGVLNVAASEVASKSRFIAEVANKLDITLDWAVPGSVSSLRIRRGESLGLDVSRAEALLGRGLPGLSAVVEALVEDYRSNRQGAMA